MKLVGMMATYNDEDIIKEVIEYYLSQDVHLVILDHMSTDNTFDICDGFASAGKISLERYPSRMWEWGSMKRALYDLALRQQPDWVLLLGSDEFIESGITDVTLSAFIEDVERRGYNIVGCDTFDFQITDDDLNEPPSIRQRMRYYTYRHCPLLFRAWKYYSGIEIQAWSYPIFPDYQAYKIYTSNLIL